MTEDTNQTLARQWTMLRVIPRSPLKISTKEIESKLIDEGFEVSRRTIERDLHGLCNRFPLVLDGRSKPYGWSWMKEANFEFMPKLTSSQSVALLLAQSHLRNLLPIAMTKDLAPVFDAANKALTTSGWKDWDKRTAVLSSTLSLLPPQMSPKVLQIVQSALAHKRRLTGHYRAKGSQTSKPVTIHPLGLLSRGSVMYLVCTLFDYADVRQLALHRLEQTTEQAESSRTPKDFNFKSYIAGDGKLLLSRGPIRLVCRFDAPAAEHLRDTPLSADQKWVEIEGGRRIEVSATVEDDEQLRWWLMGFGAQLEVVAPLKLRNLMREEASQLMALYR